MSVILTEFLTCMFLPNLTNKRRWRELFSSTAHLQKPKGNGSIGAQPIRHHWIRMAPTRYPSTNKWTVFVTLW